MSIVREGFLSPDIADWVSRYRRENQAQFDLADALNRTAQNLLAGTRAPLGVGGFGGEAMALLLFTRALSNFQGAILMAERGMVVEARTLVRTCLETVFALSAALHQEDGFIPRMVSHALGAKKKAGNWLLNRVDRADFLGSEAEDMLQAFTARLGDEGAKTDPFGVEEMARRGGLDALYIFYRQFSGDAAHPTLDALNRYVDDGAGGLSSEIHWGPECGADEIPETVVMAGCFLLAACVAINGVRGAPDMGEALEAHYSTYKVLIGALSGSASE
jgi:hypothetical protein